MGEGILSLLEGKFLTLSEEYRKQWQRQVKVQAFYTALNNKKSFIKHSKLILLKEVRIIPQLDVTPSRVCVQVL